MRTIELKVSDKIADAISRMDSKSQERLSKKLEDFVSGKSRFLQVIKEMQKEAKKNGLTQEKLDQILNEE